MEKDVLDKSFDHVKKHKVFYGYILGFVALVMIIGITYDIASPPPEPVVGNIIKYGMNLDWNDLSKAILLISFPFILIAWLIHGVGFYIVK